MRVSPKNLATSAAGWPTSSTARKATRDLASEYRLCLFPEHINSGLTPNFPATPSTNSPIGRLGRYFFSSLTSVCSNVSVTKSPLPSILASPFSLSSFNLPRGPALLPPALRTRPLPWSSGRLPWPMPFSTNSRYMRRATFWVSPKWRRTSSMVFSAKDLSLTGLTGFSGCFLPFDSGEAGRSAERIPSAIGLLTSRPLISDLRRQGVFAVAEDGAVT